MYESGLDNSPMYDETAYNDYFHTMELDDVGLNALYALDAWALSEIARELGQVTRSQQLTAEYALMAQRINEQLWSEEAGLYLNRHWDDRLSPRLSPTLFYPLIAGVASPEQAGRMVKEHLLNPDEFWGRYVMPSIARDDPGYAGNNYWRGRIWGPMNFLVGEGLRRYRFDDVAHEFARRGLDLLLGEWQSEGHVHENFNAETGDGDDMPNSDPMYTWGALLGYIAMQELVDCEPWNGWRFGNTFGEPTSLAGVSAGGTGPGDGLGAELDPQGLRVMLDGDLLVRTDRPALITGWRHSRSELSFHVATTGQHEVELTIGQLPALVDVTVKTGERTASYRTDENGQLHLTVSAPCQLAIAC